MHSQSLTHTHVRDSTEPEPMSTFNYSSPKPLRGEQLILSRQMEDNTQYSGVQRTKHSHKPP